MILADYVLQQLAAWGVRHIYGVTGDAILPLMDAIAQQADIRFIPVRHEMAAGFMATAEAKVTGRLAVCVGTSGPGAANLINGVGDAYADRVPLLVLTGQVETTKIGTGAKQYIDQQALFRLMAGYTALLSSPRAAPKVLLAALKTAAGEGRVAQVSVPKDLWAAPVQGPLYPPEPYLVSPPIPDPEALERALAMLRQAQRPVILAGHGARPAAPDLLALAERLGAGVILALGGKGMLPGNHPLVLGGVGTGGSRAAERALAQADLILVAGSTWWPTKHMPADIPVVQLDRCTAHIGLAVPVTEGLPGDSGRIIPALLRGLEGKGDHDRTEWVIRLGQWKEAWQGEIAAELLGSAEGAVPPARLVQALEQVAPAGSIIALDTGDHVLWFNRHFAGGGQQVLFSGTWRSMGFGLPAATAAKLNSPDSRVLALVGDGGLTMVLGELAVPVQEGLDLTVVVVRNGTLALEEHKARSEGWAPLGHRLENPDFAAVARSFGWAAWPVERAADLEAALRQAVAVQGPALVDVRTVNDGSLHLPLGG